jgi:hypothetical protein
VLFRRLGCHLVQRVQRLRIIPTQLPECGRGSVIAVLSGYKGQAFYTKASEALDLPPGTELVQAKKIWVPGG